MNTKRLTNTISDILLSSLALAGVVVVVVVANLRSGAPM